MLLLYTKMTVNFLNAKMQKYEEKKLTDSNPFQWHQLRPSLYMDFLDH